MYLEMCCFEKVFQNIPLHCFQNGFMSAFQKKDWGMMTDTFLLSVLEILHIIVKNQDSLGIASNQINCSPWIEFFN